MDVLMFEAVCTSTDHKEPGSILKQGILRHIKT